METLTREAGSDAQLLDFWQELRPGYLLFEENRIPAIPMIDSSGAYSFER
jgi:hypothetical protein